MEIDARVIERRVQIYRRGDGHVLGTVGKANPKLAVCNGDVVAVFYADGAIERYRASSRTMLGSAHHNGALTLAITADSLFVIHRAGLRRYDPETGRQLGPLMVTGNANRHPTAIRKIRSLEKSEKPKAKMKNPTLP